MLWMRFGVFVDSHVVHSIRWSWHGVVKTINVACTEKKTDAVDIVP